VREHINLKAGGWKGNPKAIVRDIRAKTILLCSARVVLDLLVCLLELFIDLGNKKQEEKESSNM
jgi:hypothetical protein